ncbi:efflux RND transporter periplasmic adaptor subunit [Pseudomonas aeruginosa]|uniref:efflux RND transporter periplasmic adaptor subunit n=1 Tax=Pseudomonas aeruginosa TaxID=287 RepID=UPI001495A4EC|nr:efflux RND transporter periplasmic adaptor subunit [Pseudomonas aeruginosa]MBH9516738.1 efflux RND transporter periplasmic adaptor subunit [Pseudomonas aeruginosa]MCU9211699.1 efflux RND transporter periplasmic adaptor subunit [Pseudomonas aeruginosa]HCE6123644.1 efflux RND transporter periplasmic adaptor subunit [Pseudomonas aeruginosa]
MPSRSVADRRRLKLMGGAGLGLAALVVALGVYARQHQAAAVQAWTESRAEPAVVTFTPSMNAAGETLSLPAHLQAWNMARINARVSGYLKNWHVDIGTVVKTGQPLAEIDSPELDQQLAQAKAQLAQHQASASLAQSTAERWQHLFASHSVSRQEVDEKVAAAAVANADAQAAQAEYARLKDLAAYKVIRAPFNGTITARHAQIGQLIKADSDNATSLFDIADTRRLRLYVPVPQNYASQILPGMQVQLSVPEHPGRTYTAALLGTSTSVDQSSGTLQAQYAVENASGALLPGDYASAQITLRSDAQAVSIPASALIFRAQGPQVAVLDDQSRAHLRSIHIAQDLGSKLIVDRGLSLKDEVIDNPPDALRDNDAVHSVTPGGAHEPSV